MWYVWQLFAGYSNNISLSRYQVFEHIGRQKYIKYLYLENVLIFNMKCCQGDESTMFNAERGHQISYSDFFKTNIRSITKYYIVNNRVYPE